MPSQENAHPCFWCCFVIKFVCVPCKLLDCICWTMVWSRDCRCPAVIWKRCSATWTKWWKFRRNCWRHWRPAPRAKSSASRLWVSGLRPLLTTVTKNWFLRRSVRLVSCVFHPSYCPDFFRPSATVRQDGLMESCMCHLFLALEVDRWWTLLHGGDMFLPRRLFWNQNRQAFHWPLPGTSFTTLKEDMKKVYAPYCRNHDDALALLAKVRRPWHYDVTTLCVKSFRLLIHGATQLPFPCSLIQDTGMLLSSAVRWNARDAGILLPSDRHHEAAGHCLRPRIMPHQASAKSTQIPAAAEWTHTGM